MFLKRLESLLSSLPSSRPRHICHNHIPRNLINSSCSNPWHGLEWRSLRYPRSERIAHGRFASTWVPKEWMLAGIIGIQPTSEAPSGLLVLSVIVGLPLALWTYKVSTAYFHHSAQCANAFEQCIVMYVFQRKIIYMGAWSRAARDACAVYSNVRWPTGYAPMGARSEALHKDVRVPKGIVCHEIRIPSEKRVSLSGIIVHREDAHHPETVIVYFQGMYIRIMSTLTSY